MDANRVAIYSAVLGWQTCDANLILALHWGSRKFSKVSLIEQQQPLWSLQAGSLLFAAYIHAPTYFCDVMSVVHLTLSLL